MQLYYLRRTESWNNLRRNGQLVSTSRTKKVNLSGITKSVLRKTVWKRLGRSLGIVECRSMLTELPFRTSPFVVCMFLFGKKPFRQSD